MYVLARCYDEGWGCDKNLKMAKDCYELSAEQEFIPAERRLGLCYLYGLGTDKNESEALSHFNKAAENNDVESQYYVGDLHKKAGNIEVLQIDSELPCLFIYAPPIGIDLKQYA